MKSGTLLKVRNDINLNSQFSDIWIVHTLQWKSKYKICERLWMIEKIMNKIDKLYFEETTKTK